MATTRAEDLPGRSFEAGREAGPREMAVTPQGARIRLAGPLTPLLPSDDPRARSAPRDLEPQDAVGETAQRCRILTQSGAALSLRTSFLAPWAGSGPRPSPLAQQPG